MLGDKSKKQEGKKGTPQSGESPNVFAADIDPAIRRLLTPREQWTPAQIQADKHDEDAARAQGLRYYEQVRALLGAGNLTGAMQAITPFPGAHYYNEAVQAVAQAQVQAGELLAAVATAQRLSYADMKGDIIGAVIQVLLQQGDIAGAQWLAATVTGFEYVGVLKRIAEAQHQAGDTAAARRTLGQAQERAQGFGEGDMKNGYFRSYYLREVVEAQLHVGDVIGATQTAQLIDRPEYQSQALQLMGSH
jgi:hypothetical protein